MPRRPCQHSASGEKQAGTQQNEPLSQRDGGGEGRIGGGQKGGEGEHREACALES